MQVVIYNQKGEKAGTTELPENIFGLKWNADLVHQVVTSVAANLRSSTAHAKGRGEVRGGGRKPWRQKGTGRARHGSIRSPIWKGGGVAHGPKKERSFKKEINKKMAKKALWTVLSAKAKSGEVVVLDSISFPDPKTKYAAELFSNFAGFLTGLTKGRGVMVLIGQNDPLLKRTVHNLPYATVSEVRNLNAYEALKYRYLFLPQGAVSSFK